MSDSEDDSRPKTIGVILFEGFETLDVYGPLGLLTSGGEQAHYVAVMIGPPDSRSNFVLSSSKLPTPFSQTLQWPHKEKYDILLIPGGLGNRSLLNDYEFLYALGQVANEIVERGGTILCVCTGSILLAATGVLSGYDATTNKAAFTELTPEYDEVNWVRKARWIHNNEIITSSGITAGMDAALYLMSMEFGKSEAIKAANRAEYMWNQDSRFDPFAQLYVEKDEDDGHVYLNPLS